jgi:hypothetical protein
MKVILIELCSIYVLIIASLKPLRIYRRPMFREIRLANTANLNKYSDAVIKYFNIAWEHRSISIRNKGHSNVFRLAFWSFCALYRDSCS